MSAKILVGIPTHDPISEFRRDIFQFLEACSLKYTISEHWVRGKSLIDAQSEIIDVLMNTDNTHLLFIEDDHWGFDVSMLDSLIESGRELIGIPYYSRHAPFYMTAMNKRREGEYIPVVMDSGIHQVQLIGFGFTLIHKRVFTEIGKPYLKVLLEGSKATDRWLRDRAMDCGIFPHANYDFVIPHRGITKDNVYDKKVNWFNAYRKKIPYGSNIKIPFASILS